MLGATIMDTNKHNENPAALFVLIRYTFVVAAAEHTVEGNYWLRTVIS